MKIDRLMGILTVLLRSPGVTAPELAERFEVSRRTITRDMDALCRAGVPIVSRQGAGGGFSVQPGYRVPDDLFTRQELRTLLAAAQGVDSLSGGENAARLRSRVPEGEADWIEIDLAGQSPRIKQLFPQLRDAILAESCVRIAYCGRESAVTRVVEPHRLVCKWGGWYLIAWCRLRRDFRLFKLARIERCETLGERFERRSIPEGMLKPHPAEPPCRLRAWVDASLRYRAEEDCERCETAADGRLLVEKCFANPVQRLDWALSFGGGIEVLEPEALRKEIRKQAQKMLEQNKETGQ